MEICTFSVSPSTTLLPVSRRCAENEKCLISAPVGTVGEIDLECDVNPKNIAAPYVFVLVVGTMLLNHSIIQKYQSCTSSSRNSLFEVSSCGMDSGVDHELDLLVKKKYPEDKMLCVDTKKISIKVCTGTDVKINSVSYGRDALTTINAAYEILSSIKGYATLSYLADRLQVEDGELESLLTSSSLFRKSLIRGKGGQSVFIVNTRLGLIKDAWVAFNHLNSKKVF